MWGVQGVYMVLLGSVPVKPCREEEDARGFASVATNEISEATNTANIHW